MFRVHAIDADGKVFIRRQLRRAEVPKFFSAPGHEVRLMPPAYVKSYVKCGKTDAADAAAICGAVTRPTMRFMAVKTPGQQAVLMLHKTRDLLVR